MGATLLLGLSFLTSATAEPVTTGAPMGSENRTSACMSQLLAAGESSRVANVGSIPHDLLDGVHSSEAFTGFLYWARFTDANGERWEVVYDAGQRQTEWNRIEDPEPVQMPRVVPSLDPMLLRGRIYPYMYAPSVEPAEQV